MDLQVAGRHYYLTGISRGVGAAIAARLVAEGAVVHGCARREPGLAAYRAGLPALARGRTRLDALDIRDEAALARSVDAAGEIAGRLDGIVACAGAGISGGALETHREQWQDQFDVKVSGVVHLVRAALPWLERAEHARAVFINGVTAHHPEPGMAAVSAARAAVANLGQSLAVDLAGRVGVVVVNLGIIRTDRQRDRWARDGGGLSFEDWCQAQVTERGILTGRLGTPEDVAPAVAFLLSPLAGYITATSIDLAGGSHGRV